MQPLATIFDDQLLGGQGRDFPQDLSVNDTLQGLIGNGQLYGFADNDLLKANDGIDQRYGGSGRD